MTRKSNDTSRRHFLKAAGWSAASLALASARTDYALATTPSGLKVAKVEIHPAAGNNFLRVVTNEGLHGMGEVHPATGSAGPPVRAAMEYCAEYLVGPRMLVAIGLSGSDSLATSRHSLILIRVPHTCLRFAIVAFLAIGAF